MSHVIVNIGPTAGARVHRIYSQLLNIIHTNITMNIGKHLSLIHILSATSIVSRGFLSLTQDYNHYCRFLNHVVETEYLFHANYDV